MSTDPDFSRPVLQKPYIVPKCKKPSKEMLLKMLNKGNWNGFLLPFANNENKELERQLEEKQKAVIALTTRLQDDTEHVQELRKHFSRVQYDINVTQNLLAAKKSEVMSEKNAGTFVQRISYRLTEETKITLEQVKEYQEKNAKRVKSMEKHKETIEELVKLTEFNGQALQKWKDKSRSGEEDIQHVQKLQDIDSAHCVELQNRETELSLKSNELRFELEDMAMSTIKTQEQFVRLSSKFQKEHSQRKELIEMWNNTVKAMKKRDKDMASVGEEYYEMREFVRQMEQGIKQKESSLEDSRHGTREMQHQTEQIERKLSDFRDKLIKMRSEQEIVSAEKCAYQTQVERISAQLLDLELAIRKVDEQVDKFKRMALRTEAENVLLNTRCQEIQNEHENSEKLLAVLEVLLDEQEDKSREAEEQLRNYRVFIWERFADKSELEHELQLKKKRIHKCEAAIEFNVSQNMKNEELVSRLRNSQLHIELQISQLSARIFRLAPDNVSNNNGDLQTKVHRLKEAYQEIHQDKVFVVKQIQNADSSLTLLKRVIGSSIDNRKHYDMELQKLELNCLMVSKYLKDLELELKDKLVTVSMQKVLYKRLANQQTGMEESICTLSQTRLIVETVLKERKIEIATYMTLNKSSLKSLRDAAGVLKGHIAQMSKHTSDQKKTFKELSDFLSVVNDARQTNDHQFPTFSEKIMAYVQERELMIAEKCNWIARVDQAEGELVALTNTVQLMNSANCAFQINLAPAEPNSTEFEGMVQLESEEKFALLRRHKAKKKRIAFQEKHKDTICLITVTKQQSQNLSFVCNTKMKLVSMLKNEVIMQRDKITRCIAHCQKLLAELKNTTSFNKGLEADLRFRLLKEKLEFAVIMLEKLVSLFPETKGKVLEFMDHVQLLQDIKLRVYPIGKGFKNASRHAHHFS